MRKGFSLVELVVVILVIGIIVAIAGPRFFGVTDDAREKALLQSLGVVRDAIEMHKEFGLMLCHS